MSVLWERSSRATDELFCYVFRPLVSVVSCSLLFSDRFFFFSSLLSSRSDSLTLLSPIVLVGTEEDCEVFVSLSRGFFMYCFVSTVYQIVQYLFSPAKHVWNSLFLLFAIIETLFWEVIQLRDAYMCLNI